MGLSGESIRVCSNEKQESVRNSIICRLKKERWYSQTNLIVLSNSVAMQYKGHLASTFLAAAGAVIVYFPPPETSLLMKLKNKNELGVNFKDSRLSVLYSMLSIEV